MPKGTRPLAAARGAQWTARGNFGGSCRSPSSFLLPSQVHRRDVCSFSKRGRVQRLRFAPRPGRSALQRGSNTRVSRRLIATIRSSLWLEASRSRGIRRYGSWRRHSDVSDRRRRASRVPRRLPEPHGPRRWRSEADDRLPPGLRERDGGVDGDLGQLDPSERHFSPMKHFESPAIRSASA